MRTYKIQLAQEIKLNDLNLRRVFVKTMFGRFCKILTALPFWMLVIFILSES